MAGSAATMAFLSLDCTVPVSLCVNTSRHQLWRIIERVYMCTESSDARNWFLSYFSASILGPVSLGKRWGSLNCPKVCSKDADPVCGSDGVIYTNDCELRKFTCKKSKFFVLMSIDINLSYCMRQDCVLVLLEVTKVDLSHCTVLTKGVNCTHKCTKNTDLVCGTNGKTYLNRCFLQVEFCE